MNLESSLTMDKLNLMHSILDREIESLSASTNQNNFNQQGEPLLLSNLTDKGRPPLQKDTGSFSKFTPSEVPLKSGQNKTPNATGFSSGGVYTNPFENKEKDTKINRQMQDDLNELQKKIYNLEKKLSRFNSSSKLDQSISNNLENFSEEDQSKACFKNSRLGHVEIDGKLHDLDESTTPLKQRYNSALEPSPRRSARKNDVKSRNIHKNKKFEDESKNAGKYPPSSNSSKNSPDRNDSLTDMGIEISNIFSNNEGNRKNKFVLDKSLEKLERLEAKLDYSKSSIRRKSSKGSSRKNSVTGRGLSRPPSSSRDSSLKRKQDQNISLLKPDTVPFSEVTKLNKKIMYMQKQLDEDRFLILKERKTNNELREETDRLNRKLKKMEITNQNAEQLELDYNRLLESFEKSESIRRQQKQIIENLKNEIDFLKRVSQRNKENLEPAGRESSKERENKKISLTKKSKKRQIKE